MEMKEWLEREACTGCSACAAACPQSCIEMAADEMGFEYPRIDPARCVGCGICARSCPVATGQTQTPDALQIGCAAAALDRGIRRNASSGGIFALLAARILERGGLVYGAAMSGDCRSVCHMEVASAAELPSLQGSKYVQSSMGDIFRKVRRALESGRPVLFSGTPCQIGGLFSYLKKEYENLYTVDIICHGVPAPAVWETYAQARERGAGAALRRVFFRDKTEGWRRYALRMEFGNGKILRSNKDLDPYCRGFLADLYLRPSCHRCGFKTVLRQADLTLGDFWGIEKVLPSMDDDGGTSFVWIHSGRGRSLLEECAGQLRMEEIDCGAAVWYNQSAVKPAPRNREAERFRAGFRRDMTVGEFDRLISVCCGEKAPAVIRRRLSLLKSRIGGSRRQSGE